MEAIPCYKCFGSNRYGLSIRDKVPERWPANLVEAAIWKLVGDSAAAGHLLVDLEQHTLDRKLPLARRNT